VAETCEARSVAGTVAVSCVALANTVGSAAPFHSTCEPATKPAPFTVSVNVAEPGMAADGTSGWLRKGTGLCADAVEANAIRQKIRT